MRFDQLTRRKSIALLGGAAAWPLPTRAQQGTIPRVGILAPGPSQGADASRGTLNGLVDALGDLGYTEGRNIAVERRLVREIRIGCARSQRRARFKVLQRTLPRPMKTVTVCKVGGGTRKTR